MVQRLRVLVVDDDRDLADSIVELLEVHGYPAQAAYGCDDGIGKFRDAAFDVALIDVRMPGRTGVECAAEITRLHPRTRILLMTAFGDERLLRPGEASVDLEILSKPLDTARLLGILEIFEPAGILLLVDDDIDLCASLQRVLSDRGYRVFVAPSGGEAIETAAREAVEVLLLDLRLPDINGAEIYFRLRDRGRDLPTIVITGYAAEEADALARLRAACGATCFTKPVDPNALSRAVEHALQHER